MQSWLLFFVGALKHLLKKHLSTTIGNIMSLIGHSDLDSYRVFEIALECCELQLDNDVFIELIPIFPKSHASQILVLPLKSTMSYLAYSKQPVDGPSKWKLW
ncbi:hypothetical protein VNO77_15738 [Canavalia gladiata]|uniref:Uncharacterized protein n=1 Tax=Canavalia gladiata TaxID=3824 RepID=A0AAN9QVZ3_CANGL